MRRQVRGLQDVYGEVPTTSALELRDFGEAAGGFAPRRGRTAEQEERQQAIQVMHRGCS
ncbi:hypothetical protein GHJ84_30015 [Sinorhizobium meliloti]|nr:hypothetical protein [Sinorhizobium meliloti]MQX25099.1 hypothetical protein [Sinorhizobium meliloti]